MSSQAPETEEHPTAPAPVQTAIELSLTLDEARMLRSVGQRGLLAAGVDGGPDGQPQHASAALEKLGSLLDEAETVAAVREELGQAGFDTRRLSDAQVYALARRVSEIQKRATALR
jgi:hypothetical protein